MPLHMVPSEQPTQIQSTQVMTNRHGVRLNWGGILSGSFITVGLGLSFVLLGNAFGLSPLNIINPNVIGGVSTFSWIYTFITMLVSFYVGGYCTSLASRIENRGPAIIHGLTSWAVSGIFIVSFGILTSIVFRQIILGGSTNAGNWFMACVAGFGALCAGIGGYHGCQRKSQLVTREGEKVTEKRQAA